MMFLFSIMVADTPLGKATGCDLSQDGDVALSIEGYASSKNAEYKAAKEIGKNFKELFVGSIIKVKDALVKITAIKSNKREKGKPRTGVVTVHLKQGASEQSIDMSYNYINGYFEANGKQSNSKKISFSLNIKALLCYNK